MGGNWIRSREGKDRHTSISPEGEIETESVRIGQHLHTAPIVLPKITTKAKRANRKFSPGTVNKGWSVQRKQGQSE